MIRDIDPIDLEVLRSRLESIGDQACRAVEQTAISPTVTVRARAVAPLLRRYEPPASGLLA